MTSRNVFGYSELIKLLLFISPVLDTIPFRGKHLLDHTVPYGTVPFLHAFPGTACQATIGRSLRDVACSRLFLVLVLVVEILIMKTGRQGSSSGWLAGREFTLRNTQPTPSSTRGDGRETGHALIPSSRTRNSSGSKRSTNARKRKKLDSFANRFCFSRILAKLIKSLRWKTR